MSYLPDDVPVYLKPDVKMEVTSNRWFVWPHLISPVQRAFNLAFRYVPSMQSFVANPQMHVSAAQDPNLAGGPYINLPAEAVGEVGEILARTLRDSSKLLAFAHALRAFNKLLQDTASGSSLDSLYAQMPAELAGKVELVYDVNHHPSIRVIEEILYRSELAAEDRFEIGFSTRHDDARKFFMNTPRLNDAQTFFAGLDPAGPAVDAIAAMRVAPKPLADLLPHFGPRALDNDVFRNLFTADPPLRKQPAYTGEGVRVRHFGHACVLLQSADVTVLVDPMVTCDVDSGDGRFSLIDLPDEIDYVVFSHGHQDHLSAEIVIQLRQRVKTFIVPRNKGGSLADPSLKLMLRRLGCADVRVLDTFDEVSFSEGRIVSMPFTGEHGDLDIYTKQTLFIELNGRRFFFLVDSDAVDPALYDTVVQMIGKVDGLFIGMECFGAPVSWLYGPLLGKPLGRKDNQSRRLSASNSERAWRLVTALGCAKAFIYAMGQEPWLRYLMGDAFEAESVQLRQVRAFLTQCEQNGVDVEYLQGSKELFY